MSHDFIIIGAGVLGSSIAYHLKHSDPKLDILLIDRNGRAGQGNTAKSAALYRNIFSSETSRSLSSSSIEYYNGIADEIDLEPIGYLWLYSKEQWTKTKSAISDLDPKRNDFEIIDGDAVQEILRIRSDVTGPFMDFHKGIFAHSCGSLSAMALTEHYVSMFKELGGEVSFSTEVKTLELTGRSNRYAPWDEIKFRGVSNQDGELNEASHLVVATGSWTNDLLLPVGIASGIYPKKRQLFGIKVRDWGTIFPDHKNGIAPAIILPAGGVYLKPVLKSNILLTGCADDIGQPYSMSDPQPEIGFYHKAIRPVLTSYFPDLQELEPSLKWAGYYAYHWPDKNPVIETVANLTWVSGTSGSGIMKADALGRIASAKVSGEKVATLTDGTKFKVSSLSLREREVENEALII